MNLHPDKSLKAIDELFHAVDDYRQGKDLKELLIFINRFPKIAPCNAFLLHVQKPGSEFVASVSEWKERFNRTIKPGSRPLVILWPFGPVRFVFELEDTEGDDPFPEYLLKPFKTEGKISSRVFQCLLRNLPRDGVSYHNADYGTGRAGHIKTSEGNKSQNTRGKIKISKGNISQYPKGKEVEVLYNLVVNQNHTDEEKFATIAHELGHLYCGHLGSPNEKWWPNRMNKGVEVEEYEAESISWIVCRRAGIKTPSADYLNYYLSKDGQIPQISLETVLKAAGLIESMMHRSLALRKEIITDPSLFDLEPNPPRRAALKQNLWML